MADPREIIDDLAEALVVPSFTRIGYHLRRRLFGWEDLGSRWIEGRVVLVTGATSGLGRVTADRLARMGASVRILGRDAGRMDRAAERIARAAGGADVRAYVADLSDLSDVRRVAEEVLEGEAQLDVLINNAGALLPQRQSSADGYEMTFATMVLGPFVLTNALIPRLAESDDGRIITVTSGGMYTQGLHLDDLQMEREPYRGTVAYARAKRAQVVLTRLWARKLAGSSVVAHAVHPGWADTPGVAASLPRFRRLMGPLLRTPEEGADTILWLAASEEAARSTGRLWLDRRSRPVDKIRSTRVDIGSAEALWDACVRLTGSDLPERP